MAGWGELVDPARMKKDQQQSQRAELLAAVKRGESVAEAAQRLWVPKSTAYNWVRSAARAERALALAAQPRFVELVAEALPRTTLVVRVGAAEIEVCAGFDAALLRAVVTALANGAA